MTINQNESEKTRLASAGTAFTHSRCAVVMSVAAALLLCSGAAFAKKKSKKKHRTPAVETVDDRPAGDTDAEDTDEAPHTNKAASPSEGSGTPPEGGLEGDPEATTQRNGSLSAESPPIDGMRPISAIEATLGAAVLFRSLVWNQDLTPQLSSYSLSPGPEARIDLDLFPGAFATSGWPSNIGFVGAFGRSVGVTSQAGGGAALPTTSEDYLLGLKARLPLGSVVPYLTATFGGQSFAIHGQDNTTNVPGIDYRFFRAGLGTRVELSTMFSLDVGGGYLFVTEPGTGPGEIGSAAFFPRGKAYAVDGDLAVAARITQLIALRVGVAARQYGLSFNAQKGDANIVGGAIDRYVVVGGGLAIILDGTTGSSAGGGARRRTHQENPPPLDLGAGRGITATGSGPSVEEASRRSSDDAGDE
jgi:hypothetical protein